MSFQTYEHKQLSQSPREIDYIVDYYSSREISGQSTGYRKKIDDIEYASKQVRKNIKHRIRINYEAGRIYPRSWQRIEYQRLYRLKSGESKVKKQERWRDKKTGRFISVKNKKVKYEEKARKEGKHVPKVSDTA